MAAFRGVPVLTPMGRGVTLEHIMNKQEKIAVLRHDLARYGLPPDRPPVPLGHGAADAVLGGGLARGALHEIFAPSGPGFAACLAILAAGAKPLFWVRPDYEALEFGALSATGLLELGGNPARFFVMRAANAGDALIAAADILSCAHVGALVLELAGAPKCLDLVASRRLALIAEQSGVTLLVLRHNAIPKPSAASTRWLARSIASRADDEWGDPSFAVQLLRHRQGGTGDFYFNWNARNGHFVDPLRFQLPLASQEGRLRSLKPPPPPALRARGKRA